MHQTDSIAAGEADGRRRAAAHADGPLLVLGGAGTGKSELLARRLADLAAAGTAPERVLVIGARPPPRHRATPARTLRGTARRPLRRALGRLLGRDRRAAAARARRGRRARPLLRRARPGGAAGGPARPLRLPAAAPA